MQIKHLKLVAHFSAKSDIRYYINGVMAESGRLVASDGHRLCEIQCDTTLSERVIIPIDDVKAFLARFKKKEQEYRFEIVKNGEQWQLQCAGVVQVFIPVDGRFPDFTKLIDRNVSLLPLREQFNWQYLADAERALCEFHGKKPGEHIAVVYSPNNDSRQGIIFDEKVGYHIIIMPRRIK